MAHYRHDDPDIFGFYIEVTDINNDGNVVGNVYEVGEYAEFAKHLRSVAEPLESITFIYSSEPGEKAGQTINVPIEEYNKNPRLYTAERYNVAEQVYHPQDKTRLAGLISQERANREDLQVSLPLVLHLGVENKLKEVRKPPAKPEKSKPKTLAEKMEAATKQANAHNAQQNGAKTKKPTERE
jgi:hypothetical protein